MNMPVPSHCTLTVKWRITQRIIPVYVCVSVCLPACLSIHPFIFLFVSVSLCYCQLHLINTSLPPTNTCTDTNSASCLSGAVSVSLVNEWSAHRVCLNGQYCVITPVTMSLLSAHKCYYQLPNYIGVKPLSFTLKEHQHTPFSSVPE